MSQRKKDKDKVPVFSSELVENCERLMDMHPSLYTTEDMFELICQQLNLGSVIPLAIAQLQINPLEDATYYTGALLGSILRVDSDYWRNRQDQQAEILEIIARLPEGYEKSLELIGEELERWRGL